MAAGTGGPELESEKWIRALLREVTDNGKNAHDGLYRAIHSFYDPLRHDGKSEQPASYYIPDLLTDIVGEELEKSIKRVFSEKSLREGFSKPNPQGSLRKLLVIAVFSFKNYQWFLMRTLQLVPDISDGNLPLEDNPASDDPEYTKYFDVFFWNQYLFCGRGSSFLERIHRKVSDFIKEGTPLSENSSERERTTPTTAGLPEDVLPAEGSKGKLGSASSSKVYSFNTIANMGFPEGHYMNRV